MVHNIINISSKIMVLFVLTVGAKPTSEDLYSNVIQEKKCPYIAALLKDKDDVNVLKACDLAAMRKITKITDDTVNDARCLIFFHAYSSCSLVDMSKMKNLTEIVESEFKTSSDTLCDDLNKISQLQNTTEGNLTFNHIKTKAGCNRMCIDYDGKVYPLCNLAAVIARTNVAVNNYTINMKNSINAVKMSNVEIKNKQQNNDNNKNSIDDELKQIVHDTFSPAPGMENSVASQPVHIAAANQGESDVNIGVKPDANTKQSVALPQREQKDMSVPQNVTHNQRSQIPTTEQDHSTSKISTAGSKAETAAQQKVNKSAEAELSIEALPNVAGRVSSTPSSMPKEKPKTQSGNDDGGSVLDNPPLEGGPESYVDQAATETDNDFDNAEDEPIREKPSKLEEHDSSVAINSVQDQSYFFSYFMTICVLFILCYVGYHNKQKILALILEGRRGRRPSRTRRPNSANYHKLDSNLEEAVTSSCAKNSTPVIY